MPIAVSGGGHTKKQIDSFDSGIECKRRPPQKRFSVGCSSPFTPHRPTPHGSRRAWCKQPVPSWSVKTRRAPSRPCWDARFYGHATTAMYDISTPPLPLGAVPRCREGLPPPPSSVGASISLCPHDPNRSRSPRTPARTAPRLMSASGWRRLRSPRTSATSRSALPTFSRWVSWRFRALLSRVVLRVCWELRSVSSVFFFML